MASIPNNITKGHLLKAIERIDIEGIPSGANSQYYDVLYDGKRYPPKLVVSWANTYANGKELARTSFEGGKGTPCFKLLEQKGFPIMNKKENTTAVPPNIWFVCQGTTYNDAQGKQYLWAPEVDKKGVTKHYWKNTKAVKKGDYIFHYADGLRGISTAASDGYASENPMIESQWRQQGTQVDITSLFEFEQPIHYSKLKAVKDKFATYLKNMRGPFDSRGEIKQGYLFKFNQAAGKLVRELYGHSFPEPYESMFKLGEQAMTLSTKDIIDCIYKYILGKGFYFTKKDISNFYLSLKTKPFVILAGISGTGKTQLARLFIEALGYPQNCVILPVRPDWTDNSDLIGYTDLSGNFQPKPLLHLLQRAQDNPSQPFFLILDEMNLARVEYYFSDFLSVIESRQWNEDKSQPVSDTLLNEDTLLEAKNGSQFVDLRITGNLFVIGTVNMDETTHPFSRKVLDRANSIEMNRVDLGWKNIAPEDYSPLDKTYNSFLQSEYVNSKDISQAERESLTGFIKQLQTINTILEEVDLQFAYRVRDEMAFYLLLNTKYDLLSNDEALDFQFMQKILPRIQGSSIGIKNVLLKLLHTLEGVSVPPQEYTPESLNNILSQVNELRYPNSTRKICFMLRRYYNDRFTSFWQ